MYQAKPNTGVSLVGTDNHPPFFWLGLTGGLGTGKSSVAQALKASGEAVIDADQIAKGLLMPGQKASKEVLNRFGSQVTDEKNQIDRRLLGRAVFSDPQKLSWLEQLLHPKVKAAVEDEKKKLQDQGVTRAFYDVPLLFEKNMEGQFDKIIVVTCNSQNQKQRLQKRNQWSAEEINQRLSAQKPLKEKIQKADYVITNDGNLEDLQKEVVSFLKTVQQQCC